MNESDLMNWTVNIFQPRSKFDLKEPYTESLSGTNYWNKKVPTPQNIMS